MRLEFAIDALHNVHLVRALVLVFLAAQAFSFKIKIVKHLVILDFLAI